MKDPITKPRMGVEDKVIDLLSRYSVEEAIVQAEQVRVLHPELEHRNYWQSIREYLEKMPKKKRKRYE
jgi:hypothetical protein